MNASIKFILIIASLFLLGCILIFLGYQINQSFLPTEQPLNANEHRVIKVIDGDTIEIEGGQVVRYVGIDTPETVDPRRAVGCFGKEASDKNKEIVESQVVILEKDVSEVDKYNRLLRYVYLKQADSSLLFVNDYLVREGYAKNYTYPPDIKFNEQFKEAEREARENNRGLWNKCTS